MAREPMWRLLAAACQLGLGCVVVGCGGGATPPPEEPQGSEAAAPVETPKAEAEAASEAEATPHASEPPSAAVAEPEFKPGMSVIEAVNAVPQGAERVEIEHDVLVAPLMQSELYAPCKLRGNQHFTVKVAVWDGRVVGLDVEASPKSEAVTDCLRKQIEALTWKKKVKSLSTVEFNY